MRAAIRAVVLLLSLVSLSSAAHANWDAHLAKLQSAVPTGRPGLYGHDGVQWAGATKFKATKDEMGVIIAGFANPAALFANGPKVEGTKYMTTRADAQLIVLKKGTKGVVFAKTDKTVVALGFDEATVTPAKALSAVEGFAAYLKSIGF